MAIGWLTVLKNVPWSDVISSAPKVADGAKKLWSTVGKKAAGPTMPVASQDVDSPPEARSAAELQARLAALEAAAAGFHEHMLASSGLIKSLAEQNAQLVKGVEANRVRLGWLAGAVALAAALAAVALALAVMR